MATEPACVLHPLFAEMEQTIEEKDSQLAAQKEAADKLAGGWPELCKVLDNQATFWLEFPGLVCPCLAAKRPVRPSGPRFVPMMALQRS